jgi:hypothetical protein
VCFRYVEDAYIISRKSKVKFLQSIISSPVLRSRSMRAKRKKDIFVIVKTARMTPLVSTVAKENSENGDC